MTAGKSSAVAGLAAELGCAAAHTAGGAETSGEQADLLAFDGEMALFADQAIAPPLKRGAGRPPGSPNRTTLQLQRYLQARGYRDPAEFLASLVSANTVELARSIGCEDKIEVLKLQRAAAAELMPYFHSRMPTQVEVADAGARPLVMIQMHAPGALAEPAADAGTLVLDVRAAGVRSHDVQSHEDSQAVEDAGQSGEPAHD